MHAAEQTRPTDCGPAADAASEGAAVQAHPHTTSHLQTHEVTTSGVETKNVQLTPTTDPMAPATRGPPDRLAVVKVPETQNEMDQEFRSARGRYNLR